MRKLAALSADADIEDFAVDDFGAAAPAEAPPLQARGGERRGAARRHINCLSVKSAKYVGSATALDACPPPDLPEFAVIGRSNVGKSTLINLLTKSKKLALTSKQPGAHRAAAAC